MKRYKILKGWHYAFFLFGRLCGWHYDKKQFIINFKFSSECYWVPPRNQDDYDLNKLYGITFGMFNIHKDSVRLTWVPKFGSNLISIYGYIYDKSSPEHVSQYICDVEMEKEYTALITLEDKKYHFSLNGTEIYMDNTTPDNKVQKEIYPYFGGNNRAITTMYVYADLMAV